MSFIQFLYVVGTTEELAIWCAYATGIGEPMLSQVPIGIINLITNPLPKRHWKRDLDISTRYSRICSSIETARNPSKAKIAARKTLLDLAPLYEGSKIISLLEEALSSSSSPSDKKVKVNNIPITMAELEDFLELRALETTPEVGQEIQGAKTFLTNEKYVFDLLHYDKSNEKILWLHMAYGLAEQPKFLNVWKEQSLASALQLVPLIEQYYGKDIKCIDIACIDPLLEHSRKDIEIWALSDADQLTGMVGTAQKIATWRFAALEDLNVMLNTPTARDEEKLRQQLAADIRSIVYAAHQNESGPNLRILIPQ